jgi:hypothetical protein
MVQNAETWIRKEEYAKTQDRRRRRSERCKLHPTKAGYVKLAGALAREDYTLRHQQHWAHHAARLDT